MKSLPSWIWLGAWLLAFVAGMVNVLGFLGFEHQMLTHMTGLTSQLGISLATRDTPAIFRILAVMTAFVSGAFLSGLLLQNDELRWGSRYGVALLIEGILLTIAAILLHFNFTLGFYLASFACGLQNAMVATFSGSVIRTTHVSGMFTDLGMFLGHALRRLPVDKLRVRICLSTITGFCSGGIAAAILHPHLGLTTLLIPASMTLLMSLSHKLLRHRYTTPPNLA